MTFFVRGRKGPGSQDSPKFPLAGKPYYFVKIPTPTAMAPMDQIASLSGRNQLDYVSFLEFILSDEVNRRADRRMELRVRNVGFGETCRLEDFDWSAAITLDPRLLHAVFPLEFLSKHEHVLLVGPAGVGKTFLARALGFSAIRAGHTVRFLHADDFFRAMAQTRVDNSLDRTSGPFSLQTCSFWTT